MYKRKSRLRAHEQSKLMEYFVVGSTARATKWQYAHKFAPVEVTTILRAIEIQVGVNGRLTPRAHVDPALRPRARPGRAPPALTRSLYPSLLSVFNLRLPPVSG